MAEKFEVPKRFSKDWWAYIYEYYKYHILAAVLVLVFLIYIVNNIINPVRYDANVVMAGDVYVSDEQSQKLESVLAELAGDIDGNGKKSIYLLNIFLSSDGSNTDVQLEMAYRQKLSIEMFVEDNMIFILDSAVALQYLEQSEEAFFETKDWAGDFGGKLLSHNGKDYGVSLENNSFLKECGIDGSDLYLVIKNTEILKKNNEERVIKTIDFAKKIIDN